MYLAMRQINNKQDLANRITESVLKEMGLKHSSRRRALKENREQEILDKVHSMRSNIFDMTEEGYGVLYIDYDPQTNELYAGGATNAGIIKEYSVDYDVSQSLDYNLEGLYDEILQSPPTDDTMAENKKRIRKIVSEALRKRLNEIGDTNRGQYMLGRLAGKKEKQNYYNTYAPEQERDRQVRRISNYADEKSNGDFNKETAFGHGYHDYSKDNTFDTVGDNFERYRKQDENPILQKVGELRQMTENLLNHAYSRGNGAPVSLSDIKYMYGLSKEIHDYFDNNISSQLLNKLETMLNSKSFGTFDVVQIDDLLKDLEQQ